MSINIEKIIGLIVALHRIKPATAQELAEEACVNRWTVYKWVRHLEADGLVDRCVVPGVRKGRPATGWKWRAYV